MRHVYKQVVLLLYPEESYNYSELSPMLIFSAIRLYLMLRDKMCQWALLQSKHFLESITRPCLTLNYNQLPCKFLGWVGV